MKDTGLQMLVLVSAAAAVSGYPLVAANKRYGAWLPFRAHAFPRAYGPPSQEDLVDFYYQPTEPVHYYPLSYYYSLPEYYYETNEEEDEPEQWYVGSNGEANALFLQNLMMAQLYSRAQQKEPSYPAAERSWLPPREPEAEDEEIDDQESGTFVYGEPLKALNQLPKEDRDVRELKSLVENRWVDKREDGEEKLATSPEMRPVRKPSAYDAIKKLLIQQVNIIKLCIPTEWILKHHEWHNTLGYRLRPGSVCGCGGGKLDVSAPISAIHSTSAH